MIATSIHTTQVDKLERKIRWFCLRIAVSSASVWHQKQPAQITLHRRANTTPPTNGAALLFKILHNTHTRSAACWTVFLLVGQWLYLNLWIITNILLFCICKASQGWWNAFTTRQKLVPTNLWNKRIIHRPNFDGNKTAVLRTLHFAYASQFTKYKCSALSLFLSLSLRVAIILCMRRLSQNVASVTDTCSNYEFNIQRGAARAFGTPCLSLEA